MGTGLNIINNLAIENRFAVAENSKLLLLSGDIILLSTATNTASIAEIPEGRLKTARRPRLRGYFRWPASGRQN